MVEGKLLIRARLNACLGSHFPCRSSPWPKEDERHSETAGKGGLGKIGGLAGATEAARNERGVAAKGRRNADADAGGRGGLNEKCLPRKS